MPDPPSDSASIQLGEVWLDVCELEPNRSFAGDFDRVSYTLDTSTEVRDQGSDAATAVLRMGFVWEHKDGGELPFIRLLIRVAGRFHWSENVVAPGFVEGWLKFNGTYLLWPYARTYVATLTTLSGMPPLQIMTIVIPQPSLGHSTAEFDAIGAGDAPAE